MSRYDGLIIPRSYSEYLNKTDSATLSQMLQHLTGLWSHAVSEGDQKPVTSDAVNVALAEYINKTDAATLQQALQLPGVLSGAVAASDNKAVTSNAVYEALTNYINKTDAATIQQALQLPGVLSGAVAAGDNKAVTSNAVNGALAEYINKTDAATLQQALQLPGVLSEAVAAGDNKAVKSSAVATALAYYQRQYSITSDNKNHLIYIGKTINANNSQAFTQMKVKGGRVDGWYGEGTIYLGQNGSLFSTRLDCQMPSLTFYINKFENEYYFYCQMETYCQLVVEVMPGSKFDIVFESVNSPVGVEFWNNTW